MSSVLSKFISAPLSVTFESNPPLTSTSLIRFITEDECSTLSELTDAQRSDLKQAKAGSCTVDYSGRRGWDREFLLPLGPAEKVDLKKLRSAVHAGVQALRAQNVVDASVGLPSIQGFSPEEVDDDHTLNCPPFALKRL